MVIPMESDNFANYKLEDISLLQKVKSTEKLHVSYFYDRINRLRRLHAKFLDSGDVDFRPDYAIKPVDDPKRHRKVGRGGEIWGKRGKRTVTGSDTTIYKSMILNLN